MNLSGKISDRIRGGKLPADLQVTGPRIPTDDRPSADAVRNGKGRALGNPRRSSRDARTHD